MEVSKDFLDTIFFPKNPLHDGAVIIRGSRVIGARCYLPLTDNPQLPTYFGTRHRAAVGITEVSDSVGIIVSEETGAISLTHKGYMEKDISKDNLNIRLAEYLKR